MKETMVSLEAYRKDMKTYQDLLDDWEAEYDQLKQQSQKDRDLLEDISDWILDHDQQFYIENLKLIQKAMRIKQHLESGE